VVAVTEYAATAAREGKWWVVTVPGVGVTQSRSLVDAPATARDLVSVMLDVPPSAVSVTVTPDLGPKATEVAHAKGLLRELVTIQSKASAESRKVVTELAATGMSGKDIAAVLEMSPQRVSQLKASVKR
jgi:hypothetical protein